MKERRIWRVSSPFPLSLSTTSVQPTTVCRHPFRVVDHPPLAVVVLSDYTTMKKTSLWKEEEERIIKKNGVLLCFPSLIFVIFSNYFSLIELSFPLNIILKLKVTIAQFGCVLPAFHCKLFKSHFLGRVFLHSNCDSGGKLDDGTEVGCGGQWVMDGRLNQRKKEKVKKRINISLFPVWSTLFIFY